MFIKPFAKTFILCILAIGLRKMHSNPVFITFTQIIAVDFDFAPIHGIILKGCNYI